MEQFDIYLFLLSLMIGAAMLFKKSTIPLPLILVIIGMLLSSCDFLPEIDLNPQLVLDVFLPLLLYQISGFSSWKETKKNLRPIMLLSIGHVLFITLLIATLVHFLVPSINWPLAFVIGAVLSPPDDVAIVSITQKIRIPKKLLTILEGEGLFNDATALILFRFSLVALLSNQFSALHFSVNFVLVLVLEAIYGYLVALAIGNLRLRLSDPILHMMISLLTPFIAYLPAAKLDGCGVISVVVCGFVMSHRFFIHYPAAVRLSANAIWPTLSFALQHFLFLLVGFNMRYILNNLAHIPTKHLFFYTSIIITTLIVGRFIWVFASGYLSRLIVPSIKKYDPPRKFPYYFIISWSGMRGGISLAAALAIPALPSSNSLQNPRDLVIFLAFCTVVVTLILQGLTLPFFIKKLGLQKHLKKETHKEHLSELEARLTMCNATINWLKDFKATGINEQGVLDEVNARLENHKIIKKQLNEKIKISSEGSEPDIDTSLKEESLLLKQLLEVEKSTLLQLYKTEKISHAVHSKLLNQLDHQYLNIHSR